MECIGGDKKHELWYSIDKTPDERIVSKRTSKARNMLVDHMKQEHSMSEDDAKKVIHGDWDRGMVYYKPAMEQPSHASLTASRTRSIFMSAIRQHPRAWALIPRPNFPKSTVGGEVMSTAVLGVWGHLTFSLGMYWGYRGHSLTNFVEIWSRKQFGTYCCFKYSRSRGKN